MKLKNRKIKNIIYSSAQKKDDEISFFKGVKIRINNIEKLKIQKQNYNS